MHDFASNFLTFIERREEKLLSWGFHNVRYSESDMLYALEHESPQELQEQWRKIQEDGVSFRTLIRELRQSHLLYRLPDDPDMYRSRMAEGVRLLANLRQLFTAQDWTTGPRLVSDIKIHLRDREYPRRDLSATCVWEETLKALSDPSTRPLTKDCYDALSHNPQGVPYKFSGFQKRAFGQIFGEYGAGNRSGSVICAGTGSGKTKAFYIPTLLRVAEEISKDPTPFTKVIAIYPRNVLLADQLREALSESKKLIPVLKSHGHRPITFGALLGDTPSINWFKPLSPGRQRPKWYWDERGENHVIPYLKSTEDGQSDLMWRRKDRVNGRTCLYRQGASTPDIPDSVLRITREDCIQNSPDILFLSIEMLNREMGNPQWRSTFGIMQGTMAPRVVLLDEVHTYEGIPGAQVAWVLRRWKYWVNAGQKALSPHFVGLSATLKEAPEHMGRMCGINPNKVTEFSPIPGIGSNGEMESDGQEYNLAIKGDPSSGSALLSTSIQTGMLLTRLLTPRNHVVPVPEPPIRSDLFFQKKVFGFTDNLDSLNRWLANMTNAEAQHLASLREIPIPTPDPAVLQRMRDEGQVWELSKGIGHDLAQSLDVSRCSSQDPGVNTGSDLILATSSLEVGFDDPDVGMILHHKAPSSMSSFVQRKGRAGRVRGSRPWTVVVLSDYGRDRWAFQAAERLFRPVIERIHLPVTNPYVLRVQFALFLVDWLGQKIGKLASPFKYLAKPSNWGPDKQSRNMAIDYLRNFLNQGDKWNSFSDKAFLLYFFGQGGLSWSREQDRETARSELNDIFWEQPRPLLTEGIPSLLRKLEVEWKKNGAPDGGIEDFGLGRPMPGSIPKATFQELDISEAVIELEPYRNRRKEDELLPEPQFLRECCPGHVSKRFSTIVFGGASEPGYRHEYSGNLQPGQNNASLTNLYSEYVSIDTINNIRIYRPTHAKVIHVPQDVIESSSSEWQWNTIATTHNDEYEVPLPIKGNTPWNQVFSRATGHLHINGTWIELLRYANKCQFETRRRNNTPIQGTLTLESDQGTPEAVGFKLHTDGLRFEVDDAHLQQIPKDIDNLLWQFRYEYFLHRIKTSPALQDNLNSFQAEWMAQISMAMLCATAVRYRISLADAQDMLNLNRPGAAGKVLDTIFQVRGVDLTGQQEEPRLKTDLLGLWQNGHISSEINRLECVLWSTPPGTDFKEWIQQRYLATLAQALRVAATTVTQKINEDDLVVDVISAKNKHEILLTEKSSGGLGQMEVVVQAIERDPRFFLDAVEYALDNCPRNVWARNLSAVTQHAYNEYHDAPGALTNAFSAVRDSPDMSSLEQAKDLLISAMHSKGLNPHRANISAVSMKLLRPGSSRNTDLLAYLLNESWQRHSKKLGLEIPIRTFAYLTAYYEPSYRRLLRMFSQEYGQTPTRNQLYTLIQQLLFEGCDDSCPDCLNNPNHYNSFGKPARNLARAWLSLLITEVEVTDNQNDWMHNARSALIDDGHVALITKVDHEELLTKYLTQLFFEELDTHTYRESVYVKRVERRAGYLRVTLQIRDFSHA